MEDSKIIELYWNRSERAISETKAKYGSRCRYMANHILRNQEDVEECENDTYWAMWQIIPPKYPEVLGAFIMKIVRNLSLKKLEYNKAKKRDTEQLTQLDDFSQLASLHNNLNEAMEVAELTASINRFLEKEKRETRVIFMRRYWAFESYEEIAESFHIPEGRVRGILFRCRERLKMHLEKEGWYI